ncbi:MAG: 16S rRNA (cytosine(967)-C(5))-methyltransferase RsmB [Planctomycetaceae bacterium]
MTSSRRADGRIRRFYPPTETVPGQRGIKGTPPVVAPHRKTSRRIAYDVLQEYAARLRERDEQTLRASTERDPQSMAFITQLLDDRLKLVDPPLQERKLATELVCGVVRRRLTLDTIIKKFASRQRDRIEDGLWTLLEIGVYQLILLKSIPAHAAVYETVNICKHLRKPEWTGMLNAVLRTIERSITSEFVDQPQADAVPFGDQYRRFLEPVFADPTESPVPYLVSAFSYPPWIIESWIKSHGFDGAIHLAKWFNTPGRMSLRVNRLKTDRDKLLEVLATCGAEATPGDLPEAIRLAHTMRVEDIPGFAEGLFSVQDETAMQAANLLDPQPGETILDLCAAPGGKSMHMAERMQNQGRVVACDTVAERLQLVNSGAARLGLTIIETCPITQKSQGIPPATYDGILVDVPCSNTGVLGKRVDVRWRMTADTLHDLLPVQERLLTTAMHKVRPGGRVVYSTCSTEPAENEWIVRSVLKLYPEWVLESEQTHSPGHPTDGGYQALLRAPK